MQHEPPEQGADPGQWTNSSCSALKIKGEQGVEFYHLQLRQISHLKHDQYIDILYFCYVFIFDAMG